MPTLRSALQALNVNVESFDPQDDDPLICPACHKRMKTLQGVTAHLQTARSCQWYKKGKLRELTLPGRFGEEMMARPVDEQMVLPRQEPELDPMDVVEEYGQQMYDLIHPCFGDEEDQDGAAEAAPKNRQNARRAVGGGAGRPGPLSERAVTAQGRRYLAT